LFWYYKTGSVITPIKLQLTFPFTLYTTPSTSCSGNESENSSSPKTIQITDVNNNTKQHFASVRRVSRLFSTIAEPTVQSCCTIVITPSVWCPSPGALPTNYPDPDPATSVQ